MLQLWLYDLVLEVGDQYGFEADELDERLAIAKDAERGEKVWAVDVQRNNQVHGSIYTGKKFLVCTTGQMYHKMMMYGKPSTYEIITMKDIVFLYLDIEFDIKHEEEPLTLDECRCAVTLLKEWLITHVHSSFPDVLIDNDECRAMHACAQNKFSLHIVHRSIVFDNAQSLCARTAAFIKALYADLTPITMCNCAHTIGSGATHLSSLSVYKKNQQYRSLGASKLEKDRPLMLVRHVVGERC